MATDWPLLHRLLDALLDQRLRRARALAGWHAGARVAVDLPRLAARGPELGTPEPFLGARDALSAASDAEKPQLRRIALAFAEEHAEVACARPHARMLERLSSAQASVDLELIPLSDAARELATCPDRRRRALLAKAVHVGLAAVEADQAERTERRLESRARLELSTEAAWTALLGLDLAKLAAEAEHLLQATRDAALDLLDFRMRRANAGAGVGGPWHDGLYALELPELREHLSPHRAPELAQELARGLSLDARRIAIDAEARPKRWPGMRVAQLGREEIAILSAPLGSPADAERLARGLGSALHRTHAGDVGDADRYLIDPALPRASGRVLALPLSEPDWARRVLRLPSRAAGELARGFAVRALFSARQAAARLLAARELESLGPTGEVADHFRSRMNGATGLEWSAHGGFALELSDAASKLRAHALAERLGAALREGFNEDWWRNPRAQELLRAFWSPGAAVDVDRLIGAGQPVERWSRSLLERAAR